MAYMSYAQVVIAAIGTAAAIKQGEAQKNAQKASLRLQERAQNDAMSAAMRQDQLNAQELAKANARKPNLEGLVAFETSKQTSGAGSTLLTGVPSKNLKLGQTGLLGD